MQLTADLTGKRALVTGASSEGFGSHFARVLAASGAEVVVTARRREPLEMLVAEYGLAGLILGGAGLGAAKLVKLGILAKFGKFFILLSAKRAMPIAFLLTVFIAL